MCSYACCIFLKKISWPLEKAKSRHQKNNERHNKRGAQRPAQSGAYTPHSTFYRSQESRSLHIFHRLPSNTVYSQRCGEQGIRKKYRVVLSAVLFGGHPGVVVLPYGGNLRQ